jgi:hypothetical protein
MKNQILALFIILIMAISLLLLVFLFVQATLINQSIESMSWQTFTT